MTDTATDPDLLTSLQTELEIQAGNNELLLERLADLELALEDEGWMRLGHDMEREFTRDGLDRIIALSRLMAIKNPLIKRGVAVKSFYVWGGGVQVAAADDTVNDQVVQPLLDDRGNRDELFDAQARLLADQALTTDGQLFLTLFTNSITGAVSIRSFPPEEIRDIFCDPQDRNRPHFYLRRWSTRSLDQVTGQPVVTTGEAWYPDWRHRPIVRPDTIGGLPVRWDSPIMHVRTGQQRGMRFGVPETYAALDWARAYKLFLEDWATLVRSLSRFAWQLTTKRRPGQVAAQLGSQMTPGGVETNPSPTAGSVFAAGEGTTLTPLPKSDATVASEDGVWLAKMVAAALDLPYPVLMGDPDMGNLATAKTLDRPTELAMMARQELWADVIRDLADYAVDAAIRAPRGALSGRVVVRGGVEVAEIAGGLDRSVEVDFPPILEADIKPLLEAIEIAHLTDLVAPEDILQLILVALGVDDIDDKLAEAPARWAAKAAERTNAMAAAVAADRAGQDPADYLAGRGGQ